MGIITIGLLKSPISRFPAYRGPFAWITAMHTFSGLYDILIISDYTNVVRSTVVQVALKFSFLGFFNYI